MNAYAAVFLRPRGRVNRRTYLHGWLILTCINLAAPLVVVTLAGQSSLFWAVMATLSTTLYPTVCLTTQRLHDLGRSGWWQAYPRAATFAVHAVGLSSALPGAAAILAKTGSFGQPWFIAQFALLVVILLGLVCDAALLIGLLVVKGPATTAEAFG